MSIASSASSSRATSIALWADRAKLTAPEILSIVRDFLNGQDIACSRGVNRSFNHPEGYSPLHAQKILIHWLVHVGHQRTPFHKQWQLSFDCTLGNLIEWRYGFDMSSRLFWRENKLTDENVSNKSINPSFVQFIRQLAAPVTYSEIALAIALRPSTFEMVLLGFGAEFLRYSYCAYPQLSATVIAMTATWAFLDPTTTFRGRLYPDQDDNRRHACGCWIARHDDTFMTDIEQVVETHWKIPVYQVVEYHRFHTITEIMHKAYRAFNGSGLACVGGVALFFRIEEAFIRPALPTLISTIYTIPLSVAPMAFLGAGLGLGAAYLAKKCSSFFFTAHHHPLAPL